ncbi:MAG TPA: DUF3014 domain-containing protein [Albitalea sp.]
MGQGTSGEAMYADVRPIERRGRRARVADMGLGLAAVVAVLAVGVLSWWYRYGAHAPGAPQALEATGSVETPREAPPPAIRYPIQAAVSGIPPPAQWTAALAQGVADLFRGQALPWALQRDALAWRLVATVDNLDRVHVPAAVWPVAPPGGRFTVERVGEDDVIAADSHRRYAGFVKLVEQVDVHRAVALYSRLYPRFQHASEELGYPGRYFNDRLVDTIDHLLAAPEPAGPVAVRPVDVRGPVGLAQPWRHYEFADPGLQTLSAGQKLMVRVGPENERRLKARLRALREALVGRAAGG